MGTKTYDSGVTVGVWLLTNGHRLLDRLSGGRLGRRLGGAETVWLHVRGRKSGEPRRVPLVASRVTRDGQERFVVAGSRGGSEKNPAWALNLRAHAERDETVGLEVEGTVTVADVRELRGAERDAGYAEMVRTYKGFAGYERNTGRVIPVFELTVRTSSAV